MVDALVSGASAARRASSSLVPGTEKRFNFMVTTPKLNRFFIIYLYSVIPRIVPRRISSLKIS